MNEVDSYLQLAKELAWKAGSILRTAYNLPRPVNVDIKDGDPNDLVTETDRAIEDFLVRSIGQVFPSHKYSDMAYSLIDLSGRRRVKQGS